MNNTSIIYARVSSLNNRQTTERQVNDLNAYAASHGYEVVNVFEEHMSGAKKNTERPVLCECLEYCFANGINTLLISELSRLGRNVDEVLANVRLCKERGLNIFFQKEGLSIFDADGKPSPFLTIFISVLGTVAEMERENIYFRLSSGRKQYIERGGKLGRKEGSGKTKEDLKVEYANVIRELKKGTSIRRTAKLCDVSAPTVMKIKKLFGI